MRAGYPTMEDAVILVEGVIKMVWFFLGALTGFVFGVLFGRRNTKKVEAALTELKAKLQELEKE